MANIISLPLDQPDLNLNDPKKPEFLVSSLQVVKLLFHKNQAREPFLIISYTSRTS